MLDFRLATNFEAPALSELAFTSKAHWGYSDEFMEQCRDDLTLDPADCDAGFVTVAAQANQLLGYYRLGGTAPTGKLEDLFIDPTIIRIGLGKELLNHAKNAARNLGMTALEIHSDPNAENFYLHMGAVRIGQSPSGSVPGRFLPKLMLTTLH